MVGVHGGGKKEKGKCVLRRRKVMRKMEGKREETVGQKTAIHSQG